MSAPTFVLSEFQKVRQATTPELPNVLKASDLSYAQQVLPVKEEIKALFPKAHAVQYVELQPGEPTTESKSPLRIGVVLSGGQAPGGHNVIMGVFDFIKRHHPNSQLFGFLDGPRGIFTNNFMEISEELMRAYRNQGGFDMIRAGRDKIETEAQFVSSLKNCKALQLDGLVVIGGDDSNTNACLLAEYFLSHECATRIIGCPKTIDGDLKNDFIEISFGFDTATKTYCELIGNICLDAVSSQKYYHFIRLMGRSASHITLECALQTRSLAILGEEVEAQNQTLEHIAMDLVELIIKRAENGKLYGVVLVPEGLIEFIPEIKRLISQINDIVAHGAPSESSEVKEFVASKLTEDSLRVFRFLPEAICDQLLLDRDPHGNVQVAKIDTERLLILLVDAELKRRGVTFPFFPQAHYFGYEGRSALPTIFDSTYCYGLGCTAAALIRYNFTGCMATLRGLKRGVAHWQPAGCPLAAMMDVEHRKGKNVPVITKALVSMDSPCFRAYARMREQWKINDCFRFPGPVQFEGLASNALPMLLAPPVDAELASSTDDIRAEYPYYIRKEVDLSALAKIRIAAPVDTPSVFVDGLQSCTLVPGEILQVVNEEAKATVYESFPNLRDPRFTRFVEVGSSETPATHPLNIGIAFIGRHTPGAHNVIQGLLMAVKSRPGSALFGFLGGNQGIYHKKYFEITEDNFRLYRNTGGMDFLGRGTDDIRHPEQLAKTKEVCVLLNLDGLVLLGGSHTMTDAAIVAEYLVQNKSKTKVIGVPATVDGNIGFHLFETSVGFDTAARVYSQLIGNMMTDAASATKYWYFIRLMGRDPSHLVLECGLQTHANVTLISEYCKREGETLADIVRNIADVVQARAASGKLFGTLLVPEGLLQQIPHYKELISEINEMYRGKSSEERAVLAKLLSESDEAVDTHFQVYSAPVLKTLPQFFRKELLTKYDSNGTIQLSLVETERLLAEGVAKELKARKAAGTFKASFSPITHFFGYQGRCSFPSMFDCSLGTTYGLAAAALISGGVTGYMTTARGLVGEVSHWKVGGIPLTSMMNVKAKSIYGRNKAIVPSFEVDLNAKAFQTLSVESKQWATSDLQSNPGPTQYTGASAYQVNQTLQSNHKMYLDLLEKISSLCDTIQKMCRFGVREELLHTAVIGLSSVEGILQLHKRN